MKTFWLISILILLLVACGETANPEATADNKITSQACNRPTLSIRNPGPKRKSAHVEYAQNQLLAKGNDTVRDYINIAGGADGYFGKGTHNAVVAFQKMVFPGQPREWDGVIGQKTWEHLGCGGVPPASNRAQLAQQILNNANIILHNQSPIYSGRSDGADALSNIRDTANSGAAKRSSYGNAPGGTVFLDTRMLSTMLQVAGSYRIGVSSIAGGSHSRTSRHYAGITMDINIINGTRLRDLSTNNASVANVMQMCRNQGATEVLGPPNDSGHRGHIHCAWPRP